MQVTGPAGPAGHWMHPPCSSCCPKEDPAAPAFPSWPAEINGGKEIVSDFWVGKVHNLF